MLIDYFVMPTKEASVFLDPSLRSGGQNTKRLSSLSKVYPSRPSGYVNKADAEGLEAPRFIYDFEILLSCRRRRHLFF